MTYQELFAKAGLVATRTVEIDGLGEIRIKKRDASVALSREKLFLQHGTRNEAGQTVIAPILLSAHDVRLCVVDENNLPFLTEEQVLALPADTVYSIFNAINEFSGSVENVDDEAKKS